MGICPVAQQCEAHTACARLQGTLRLKEGEVEGDEEAPQAQFESVAAARRRSVQAMRGGGWSGERRGSGAGSGSGSGSDNSGLAPLGGAIVPGAVVPSVMLPQRRPMMATPFEVPTVYAGLHGLLSAVRRPVGTLVMVTAG